jgi:LDH2 family malate/lactate/ureidoglycolate dehydrogenase
MLFSDRAHQARQTGLHMNTAARIDPNRLLEFATAVYVAAGMSEPDAHLCADTLVQADLWGHQSHGVMRLSWYAARLKAGVCDPMARGELVVDAGGLAIIDGHDGMGQVLAAKAAQEAIARAKSHGIAAVGVRNSNHFGTALYFTLMAAREG